MDNVLTPKEVKIIQMALQQVIEDNEAVSKNQNIPLTPEARGMMKDMFDTAKSALGKLQNTTGFAVQMDKYQDGDEKEFLTKQS
jgi:hypothetical protein